MRVCSSIFAVFTLLALLQPASVIAGCGLNFEKMRHRRLEAIRGQILSKLGFSELPKDEAIQPPSEEQLKLYNITRDFVDEQARKKQAECEAHDDDWYAQDITTVYEYDPATKDAFEENNEARANYFHFDLQKHNFNNDEIITATLRLHQTVTEGPKERERVVINEIIGTKNGNRREKRSLHEYYMDLKKEGWRSFDVTDTIRRWIRFPDQNLGLELTLACSDNCACSSPNFTMETNFEGSKKEEREGRERSDILLGRGDRDLDSVPVTTPEEEEKNMKYPHLVIKTRASSDSDSKSGGRRKRSVSKTRRLDADHCLNQKPPRANCCLRELYIDFRKDLNWGWVVSPNGYKANYCAGACPYMYSGDTMHYNILYMHRMNNPNASPSPCCTPKEYAPLTLMYQKEGKYRIRQLNDLLVVSCGCG